MSGEDRIEEHRLITERWTIWPGDSFDARASDDCLALPPEVVKVSEAKCWGQAVIFDLCHRSLPQQRQGHGSCLQPQKAARRAETPRISLGTRLSFL